MGSLFRSEPMELCQMIIAQDTAFSCVAALGLQGLTQFKDTLPSSKRTSLRTFVVGIADVKTCLGYIEKEVKAIEPEIPIPDIETEDIEIPQPRSIANLESKAVDVVKTVEQLKESEAQLRKSLNEMSEYKHVLLKVDNFFQENLQEEARIEMSEEEDDSEQEESIALLQYTQTQRWFTAGVLDFSKKLAFERCLWRACKRTVFVRTAEIQEYFEDPFTGQQKKKCVFIVFFKGERIQDIVNRVCEGFKARQYPCPRTQKERRQAVFSTAARVDDLRIIIDSTVRHRHHVLTQASISLPKWLQDVFILKSVYNCLNLFKFVASRNYYVTECWIAKRDFKSVKEMLEEGVVKYKWAIHPVLNVLDEKTDPPTCNKTNKFTKIFQGIVDAYGTASYQEVNPAPFSIITFPFLFSLMFGDLGHGLIVLLAGLFLVLKEDQLEKKFRKSEILRMLLAGRYIILLMGFFSLYAGFLYNDILSKSFNLFGSSWTIPYNISEIDSWTTTRTEWVTLNPEFAYDHSRGPYLFGVDPIWNLAKNRLNFLNSMKMKMSVIIGVAQMTFGIFLSAFNHSHFKSPIDFFTSFIPQLVFLSSIFIYLCVQIILKWLFYWVKPATIFGQFYPGSYCAPSILVGLINMVMLKPRPLGFVKFVNGTDGASGYEELHGCYLNKWYPNQATVEMCLLSTAIACVPIMLFTKPLVFLWSQRRNKKQSAVEGEEGHAVDVESIELLAHPSDPVPPEEETPHEEGFGDVFVHQAIHTIEFVLGCVSHTASYLRLWALSLAHQQLSEVLWENLSHTAFGSGVDGFVGGVKLYFASMFFTALTFGILVGMEGLGAFLHTLRLHWVEFQSKFYRGLGHPFVPFSLKSILSDI
uniref:V-type proton ATPase subunit a n=1 Tax=Steinernema glaseri TaxID=37863 RepID=A0A1I7ZBV1_9BILA